MSERYLSYLLRAWRSGREPDAPWRASLENARTGERSTFAEIEGLFAFLRKQVDLPAQPGPAGDAEPLPQPED